jgi:hypothetical protein
MKTIVISYHALILFALNAKMVMGFPPAICVLSPVLQIEAGSVSKATYVFCLWKVLSRC